MSKSLFDHIKGITFRKTKWEELTEEDKKSWTSKNEELLHLYLI
jgi:hypothetical protein